MRASGYQATVGGAPADLQVSLAIFGRPEIARRAPVLWPACVIGRNLKTTLLQLIPVSHAVSEKAHGREGLKGWKLCLHHCLRAIEKGWPLFNRTAGPREDSPCSQAGLVLLHCRPVLYNSGDLLIPVLLSLKKPPTPQLGQVR